MKKTRLGLRAFRACVGSCSALTIVALMAQAKGTVSRPRDLACGAVAALALASGFFASGEPPGRGLGFRGAKDGELRLAVLGLSARERELVLLFVRGASMKQIAIEKGLSHSTVRTTFCSAYAKLGVKGSAGLTALGALYKMV